MHHDVDADRDQSGNQDQGQSAQGIARPREGVLVGLDAVWALVFVAQVTEYEHDPEYRAEQDELLPKRVKGAEVEVQRGDQVGSWRRLTPTPTSTRP